MKGAEKLAPALDAFRIEVAGVVAADLGCNVGGFTSVLIERGAERVYAVDTGHGMLAAELRAHPRVVVMERTNALHVELPELVTLVVADMAWTQQRKLLPAAWKLLAPGGALVSLLKPHYEAPERTRRGVLDPGVAAEVAGDVCRRLTATGFPVRECIPSSVPGGKGNREFFILLLR